MSGKGGTAGPGSTDGSGVILALGAVVLVVVLIILGLPVVKGWADAARTEAEAHARAVDQDTEDQRLLDEQTRGDRALALGVTLIGISSAFAVTVIIIGVSAGWWGSKRMKVRAHAPVVSQCGGIVTVHIPSQRDGEHPVTFVKDPAEPMFTTIVVIGGEVQRYTQLTPEIMELLVEAKSWRGIADVFLQHMDRGNSRRGVGLLEEVMRLFQSLGRPTDDAIAAYRLMDKSASRQQLPLEEQ